MKLSDVRVGRTYETKVGADLVRVVVVYQSSRETHTRWGQVRRQIVFYVRRADAHPGAPVLPKARSAAALREVRGDDDAVLRIIDLQAREFEAVALAYDRANQNVLAWGFYAAAQRMRTQLEPL